MRVRPMRILLTADPELPVPPGGYGGIERIIAGLVDGLVERGHEVTLVAHPESGTRGSLAPYPASHSRGSRDVARNAAAVLAAFRLRRPEVVHSFGRLAYLAPLLPVHVSKLMSYQRPVTRSRVKWASRLAGRRLQFSGCSAHLVAPVRDIGIWHVVHNSVPVERFAYAPAVDQDAPLAFLGRIEQVKGAHLAIDIARRAGRRLVIAGNIFDEHRGFFETEVAPHIDGQAVTYVGEVDDEAKSAMLSRCAALLMPVLWDEPFGIVMAEALACGTPVIGLSRGAVPEVVEDGTTGFVCESVDDMVACVAQVGTIERSACRSAAEKRFATGPMVAAYEAIYGDMRWGHASEPTGPPARTERVG